MNGFRVLDFKSLISNQSQSQQSFITIMCKIINQSGVNKGRECRHKTINNNVCRYHSKRYNQIVREFEMASKHHQQLTRIETELRNHMSSMDLVSLRNYLLSPTDLEIYMNQWKTDLHVQHSNDQERLLLVQCKIDTVRSDLLTQPLRTLLAYSI